MVDADVRVQLFYSGAWQDAPAYTRDQLRISRGLADDKLEPRPTTAPATLENRDGSKNPNNPVSPLYGLVGRNTPMQILIDNDIRASVEVADWELDRSIEPVVDSGGVPRRGDAICKVAGAGILRRLTQGASPLKSPGYRAFTLSTTNRVAWWPLEDGPGATTSASPIGSPAARQYGFATKPPQWGAYTGCPATERMVTMGDNDIQCIVPPYSGLEHKVIGLVHVPWDDATFNGRLLLRIDCTNVRFETVWGNAGSLTLECRQLNGTLISSTGAVTFGLQGFAALLVYEFEQSGSDVFSTVRMVPMDSAGSSNVFTFTGVTMGRIESIRLTGETASWGQVGVGKDTAAFDDASFFSAGFRAMQGWNGEEAGTRFMRLCSEEGITGVMVGDQFDTQKMGPQGTDTLVEVLKECARTDAAMMYELRTLLGLRFRTGRNLTNQAPALTLNYAAKQVAPPFVPVVGDHGSRNDVTAEHRTGSKYRAVLESGAMSVQAPPNGIGRYDTKLPVNVYSVEQLTHMAWWHLRKGTIDETRFKSVTIDLDSPEIAAEIIAAVNAVNMGDVIAINNLLPEDSYDPARLIAISAEEVVRPRGGRVVTFATVPAAPYEVAISGSASGATDLRGQAVDTDGSTLSASVAAAPVGTSMTISVATIAGYPLWTTDSNDWDTAKHGTSPDGAGLFLRIGGEDMRVTNITGAASPQTLTVLRGQNGVVKAHASGAPVHVRYPAVVGL